MFDKGDVNGLGAHPVYQLLRREQPESVPAGGTRSKKKGELEWNYVKFLVSRDGKAVKVSREGGGLKPQECQSPQTRACGM